MDWQLTLNFLLALVAIINPIGKVPIWVESTVRDQEQVRKRLALLLTVTAAGILLVFLWAGRPILEFFGVDLAAFRVGGGIVILLVGIQMLNGTAASIETDDDEEEMDAMKRAKLRFGSLLVPLVTPLVAGPGTITTVVIYSLRARSLIDYAMLSGVLLATMSVVYGTFYYGHTVRRFTGLMPLKILTRIFGLLLAAIAAQFILEGLGSAFPTWVNEDSEIVEEIRQGMDTGATGK